MTESVPLCKSVCLSACFGAAHTLLMYMKSDVGVCYEYLLENTNNLKIYISFIVASVIKSPPKRFLRVTWYEVRIVEEVQNIMRNCRSLKT